MFPANFLDIRKIRRELIARDVMDDWLIVTWVSILAMV
jgi:hypothetical protein